MGRHHPFPTYLPWFCLLLPVLLAAWQLPPHRYLLAVAVLPVLQPPSSLVAHPLLLPLLLLLPPLLLLLPAVVVVMGLLQCSWPCVVPVSPSKWCCLLHSAVPQS